MHRLRSTLVRAQTVSRATQGARNASSSSNSSSTHKTSHLPNVKSKNTPPRQDSKGEVVRSHRESLRRREEGLQDKKHQTTVHGVEKADSTPWIPTPSRGLGSTQLEAELQRYQSRQAFDPAQIMQPEAAVQSSDMMAEDDGIGMAFAPGTFVETRKCVQLLSLLLLMLIFYRNEYSTQAVVLAEIIEQRRWRVISLNDRGDVHSHTRADVHFAIPNFVSQDLAARCGAYLVTSDPSEIQARVEVLRKLKLFKVDAEAAYKGSRNWERQRAVNIYNEVKSPDPTRWGKTTVSHIAHLMYQQPTYINYYAAHQYLIENPLHYIASSNYLEYQTYSVRPARDIEEIEKVQAWIGQHRKDVDGPLKAFLRKARIVLAESKKIRTTGPTTQTPTPVQWDETDQVFLRFLIRSTHPYRSNQRDPYSMGRTALMKFLAPSGPQVSDHETHQMLIRLGVIAPWQDLHALTPLLNPTGDFYVPDPLEKDNEAVVKRSLSSQAIAGAALGPEDLHPTDPLESVRRDFGNATVFMIDDVIAEELDDGVSLERIPSEPDNYWVHVHIADPASYVHPGHVLGLRARDRWVTHYLSTKSFPLFPKDIVHGLGISLGDRSNGADSNRTLTFSVKLDSAANILDYRVSASLIRNVRKITYDQVDQILGHPRPPTQYPFGRIFQEEVVQPASLTEQEIDDLKVLTRLADASRRARLDQELVMMSTESAKIKFKDLPDNIQSPSMTGTIFEGFPQVEYSVSSPNIEDRGARSVVSELMKVACRICSRFGLEHNLSLLHRHVDPVHLVSDDSHAALMAKASDIGYVNMALSINHILVNPSSGYSLLPKQHYQLGIPDGEGYSRATSPLRRFEDLVNHWQLHHALLGSKASPRPPFSDRELEALCIEATTKDRAARTLGASNTHVYALMFIKRWMEDTKRGVERTVDDPLMNLTAIKTGHTVRNLVEGGHICSVLLPQLGLKAHLVGLDNNFSLQPLASAHRVKVKSVQLGVNRPRLDVVLA